MVNTFSDGLKTRVTAKNQRFIAPIAWEPHIVHSHPAYRPLDSLLPMYQQLQFPAVATLNSWWGQLESQIDYLFVDSSLLDSDSRYYEVFIAQTGQIPTRAHNWHDLFGACSWMLYPRTKRALNQRHLVEIEQSQSKQRSGLRHQLTLFDECGVVLLYRQSEQWLVDMLRQHRWHEAFVLHASCWDQLCPLVFGHAIWEMLTRPFIGLTAKLLPIMVDDSFFTLGLPAQLDFVDTQLCKQVDEFSLTDWRSQLSPLPILGIPGWYPVQDPGFYQRTDYFRPKRDLIKGCSDDRDTAPAQSLCAGQKE